MSRSKSSIPFMMTLLALLHFLSGSAEVQSFRPMFEHLEKKAAELEALKDTKCWTSLKQLETFIAGAQLSPATTHLKAAVVMNYIDQVWRAAAGDSSRQAPIDAETFNRVLEEKFPYRLVALLEYRVGLKDWTLKIPRPDIDNYLATVEPIRLVQTLVQQVAQQDPDRPSLSPEAIDSACFLAAFLSAAVLKEANNAARENGHGTIGDQDVLAADLRIGAAARLNSHDPAGRPKNLKVVVLPEEDLRETMRTNIRQKIDALDVFNTRYSREKLNRVFTADLGRHETEWAGLPVDTQASKVYKEKYLVEAAKQLYLSCDRQHPDSNLLTGAEMLEMIVSFYPFVTTYVGLVNLLPTSEGVTNIWVEEFEADSFRDSAWHWKALDKMLEQMEMSGESPPPMDLYAMEELSEFLSVYAVSVLKVAGILARNAGEENVTLTALDRARQAYEEEVRRHRRALSEDKVESPSESSRASQREAVQHELEQAYIDEQFTDVTERSGIDFQHQSSEMVLNYRFSPDSEAATKAARLSLVNSRFPHLEIGIAGGGVAVEDVDGDGLLDIYLVNGHKDRLYRNLGGLRFQEITAASGLANQGEGRGAYFADYDGDGDADLFLTQVYAPNRLFRNRGDGLFEDVTREAGLPLRTDLISHSAVWFDFDNDGFLDLYVGNFGDWPAGRRPVVGQSSRNGQANLLYRNNGRGGFEDITEKTGAGDVGWTHAVSHFDANNDGWQDLYLANDFGEDVILVNFMGERFIDDTPKTLKQKFYHSMSVGFTDFNKDGVEDVYVSNIAIFSFLTKLVKPGVETLIPTSRETVQNLRMIETNLFLVSSGESFVDRHHQLFDRSPEDCGWAWDADFFDFDNDGQEDLYVVNGREPDVMSYDRQRNVLFKQSNGHFYDISSGSGADFRSNARGTAYADFDQDGDLDIILNNFHSAAVLLRNNLQRRNWVRLRLEGRASNRDAVGARVKLFTAVGVQTRTVRGGSGFLSKDPYALHFGLGRGEKIDRIHIVWPSGRSQTIRSPAINREHRIIEPS
ncbi:CRTAC1 family protein [Acidobacteria bacterium AH-259-O06]|nr:CRTAC1 family protein [Acidobacteria bacterium AH-259-O06]